MERVTGIEPAWPAWKAWDSKRHLNWSAPSQTDAVPFECLNVSVRAAARATAAQAACPNLSPVRAAVPKSSPRLGEPVVQSGPDGLTGHGIAALRSLASTHGRTGDPTVPRHDRGGSGNSPSRFSEPGMGSPPRRVR